MVNHHKFQIALYGAFRLVAPDGGEIRISSAKQRALIAILAMASRGTHSRSWLQEMLWGRSGLEHGRASLRRALADLKRQLGELFEPFLEVTTTELRIPSDTIEFIGSAADGEFLEGIKIAEPRFEAWLGDKRRFGNSANPGSFSETPSATDLLPRLAVVPFQTVGGHPTSEHFSDMLSLEVIRALSRSRMVQVISHLSSRQFTGPGTQLKEIEKSLDVDFLVHGTMRGDGDRFRVDLDFINVRTGAITWTRTFEGKVSDVVSASSNVCEDIALQIGRTVLNASIELATTAPLPEVSGHALFLSSISWMHRHRLALFSKSRTQLEELIDRMPGHSVLHAWLGKWFILAISQGWSVDPGKDMVLAADSTARALDINPNCALSLTIEGMVRGDQQKDMGLAAKCFDQAVEYDPNHSYTWLMYSRMRAFEGNGPEAVNLARKARALSPVDPHMYFYDIINAMAHNVAQKYDEGRTLALQSLRANPRHTSSYRVLAISEQMLGLEREAKATVRKLMALEPGLTIENYLKSHPASSQSIGLEWAHALETSGVPRS